MKFYFVFLANNNNDKFIYLLKTVLKRGIIYFSLEIIEKLVKPRKEIGELENQ